MKKKSILGIVILGVLIAFLAFLLSKRANDVHSINHSTGLTKLSAAYDTIRSLEGRIAEGGVYPECYSGSYVDENWHVVVCLVDDSDKNKAIFDKYLANVKVTYKKVSYSYNTLLESRKLIEHDFGRDIRSVSVDVSGNKLIVCVEEHDQNLIDCISREIKADMVSFREVNCATKPPAGTTGRFKSTPILPGYPFVSVKCFRPAPLCFRYSPD